MYGPERIKWRYTYDWVAISIHLIKNPDLIRPQLQLTAERPDYDMLVGDLAGQFDIEFDCRVQTMEMALKWYVERAGVPYDYPYEFSRVVPPTSAQADIVSRKLIAICDSIK